ncbi:MAG: hypothetical protein M3362_20510, partial [Acidobacteriota bacterium]|nr:hypothetical protein [Acidobacteriota bacterium]
MLTLEEKLQRSRWRFEFVGALICAFAVGSIISLLDGSSLQPVNRLTLIKCLLVALACFLAAFWLAKQFWIAPISRFIPSWLVTALIGSTVFVHLIGLFSLVGIRNYYVMLVLSGVASLLAMAIMG